MMPGLSGVSIAGAGLELEDPLAVSASLCGAELTRSVAKVQRPEGYDACESQGSINVVMILILNWLMQEWKIRKNSPKSGL